MRWTKQHSHNAVAAKARKRMAPQELSERLPVRVFMPRRVKPDFIVRIESGRGERLRIAVHRFMGRVRTTDGQSVRQFCRGLEQLLTKSA